MTAVVVLGMHRSGTSCVAKALHEGGLYLGPELMDQTSADNLEGHWEALEAVRINDAILAASGAAWDSIPPDLSLVAPGGIDGRIAAFVSDLAQRPMHGFKDPRTLITFPLWKPHLGEVKIVACLRHPYNVARSLARRRTDEWTIERGLKLWTQYNARLLRYCDEADPASVYWFDYDAEPGAVQASLESIVRQLGLNAPSSGFNPFLRHHEEQPVFEDPIVAELYAELRQRAAVSAQTQISSPKTETPSLPLQQLRAVHSHHDELLQRQQAALADVQQRLFDALCQCERLTIQRDELAARCHHLEESLVQQMQSVEKMIYDCGQSFAAKLYEQHQAHAAAHNYLEQRLLLAEQALVCPRLVRRVRDSLGRSGAPHTTSRHTQAGA